MSTLTVLMNGETAGELTQDKTGKLTFTYNDDWRQRIDAIPISLSMPIQVKRHLDPVVRAFLWGLLPDNDDVLNRWGKEYRVSPGNPFALLANVGEDCAGAIQFGQLDRLAELTKGGVEWVTDDWIAERLGILKKDPSAWHLSRMTGQFSLAGAQAKTALLFDGKTGRWGQPWGNVPTTHILKPAVQGFDEHDLNEHLCLTAARLVGIEAAATEVSAFGAVRVIVVERYDRTYLPDGTVIRIHQEDTCQATGLSPNSKYQNDGGPSPEAVIELLRNKIQPARLAALSVARFVDALIFNWLIAGTDAHAKNYSLLLAPNQVRLAPLYDVSSALPYDDMYLPKLSMAMKIGGEYRLQAVVGRHWKRFADQNELDADRLMSRAEDLASLLPDAIATAGRASEVQDLNSSLPAKLIALLTKRAQACTAALRR